MKVPVINRTSRDIELGLEPEGDVLTLSPGQTVVIVPSGQGPVPSEVEIDIEEGLISVSMMCNKEVWSGDKRLR